MRVVVHVDRCVASGACVLECPEVFNQDEDGRVILLQENPPRELKEKLRAAAAACPAAVIEIEE